MANFFSVPRNRDIVYTPEVSSIELISKSSLHNTSKWTQAGKRSLRVISDNIAPTLKLVGMIKNGAPKHYTLPGVQSAKWTYARDVTEQYGLQRYTLLPWYTKAIAVTITGKYYMGAFVQDTIISTANLLAGINKELVAWIRKEMSSLDSKIINLGGVSKKYLTAGDQKILSSLAIGPADDPDSMELLGFIRRFSISESVDSPFIQQYDMEYIGIDREWYIEAQSYERVRQDGAR